MNFHTNNQTETVEDILRILPSLCSCNTCNEYRAKIKNQLGVPKYNKLCQQAGLKFY